MWSWWSLENLYLFFILYISTMQFVSTLSFMNNKWIFFCSSYQLLLFEMFYFHRISKIQFQFQNKRSSSSDKIQIKSICWFFIHFLLVVIVLKLILKNGNMFTFKIVYSYSIVLYNCQRNGLKRIFQFLRLQLLLQLCICFFLK